MEQFFAILGGGMIGAIVFFLGFGTGLDSAKDDVKKGRAIYVGETEFRCKQVGK